MSAVPSSRNMAPWKQVNCALCINYMINRIKVSGLAPFRHSISGAETLVATAQQSVPFEHDEGEEVGDRDF